MTDHLPPPDPNPDPDRWDAIARFLAGEGSAADSAEVRQWLSDNSGDAHVVASLDALLPTAAADALLVAEPAAGTLSFGRPIDVESALRSVHAQMAAAARPAPVPMERRAPRVAATTGPGSRRRSWAPALWAAAALFVGAAGLRQWTTATPDAMITAAVTYNTPVGATDSVTLSDGSRVILAAGSRLVVAADYGLRERAVALQGAGHFTVQHNAARPFSVHVGSAVVRDLGTVFTVKAAGGAGVIVTVTEGSVTLGDSAPARSRNAVNLEAGDRARLLTSGLVVSERGVVAQGDEGGWVTGKLAYRDAPLAEVQEDLRRWYGVELVVRDSSLQRLSVTAEARTSEPVNAVVGRLAAMWGGAAVSRVGDTVFVDRAVGRLRH